jgi:thioredoxin-related protein
MRGGSIAGLVLGLLSFFPAVTVTAAPAPKVAEVRDLSQAAALSRQQHVPLMLMFSAKGCSYCTVLEEDFLRPMLLSGDYTDKVLIRKVDVDAGDLRDFDGTPITSAALAARYKVVVTPTLVFLDPQGHQLTRRMVGLSTPDMYGGYLDESINVALGHFKAQRTLAGECAPSATVTC